MNGKKFTVGEAVGYGWETFRNNLGFLIGVFIVYFIFQIFAGEIASRVWNASKLIGFIAYLGYYYLMLLISVGLIRITLDIIDGERGKFGDLFSQSHLILNYFLGSLLYGLIVTAGLMLFIVPGIIWGIKFRFYDYLIIDQGLGPIEALKKSSAITRGHRWDLLLLFIVVIGIAILGLLALIVGIVIAYPIVFIATAYVYRKLLNREEIIEVTEVPVVE